MTSDANSTTVVHTSVAPPVEAGGPRPVDADSPRSSEPEAPAPLSRRRKGLLAFLVVLLAAFALFTAWYLINRKPITTMPLPGIAEQQLPHYSFSIYGTARPLGVAVSASGDRIYVTDTTGDLLVHIYDGSGTQIGVARPPSAAPGNHVPVYAAIDPATGELYVSDRPAGALYIYSADGSYRRTFDPGPALKGWQPLGLGFDRAGDLFVTDVSGPYNRVHEFDAHGTLVRSIGKQGQFNFPNGVAVDGAGYIYVTDSNNGRLVVFDSAGNQVSETPRGSTEGDLGLPRGISIDGDGHVFVVDTTAQGVQVYRTYEAGDQSPQFIGRFGVEGTEDGAFSFPNGVAVDGRARVYVTDAANNRVQVWSY